jgi:hypothetical protein
MTMLTGYVLGDVVTKAAYFSLAAAAFIFIAMTRCCPVFIPNIPAESTAAFFDSRTNSLCSFQPCSRNSLVGRLVIV